MSDTPFVHRNDLLRSSYVRLAAIVLAIVFAVYLAAGAITYHLVSRDLGSRIQSGTRLMALELQDVYERSGEEALIAALNSRSKTADPEDQILWLGSGDGTHIAGQPLKSAGTLTTGDYRGGQIGRNDADTYFLTLIPVGALHMIVGQSYEESDAISETILAVFVAATLLSAIFAGLIALILARRAQKRIDTIDLTLRAVADGDLDSRIETRGDSDDLSRLSTKINAALERLATTVEAIRQVSVDIAHDLRTPINRLTIRLETLRDGLTDTPELEESASASLDEAQRITRTFDALLRISQIEAGARRARFHALPLDEIASSLRDAYEAVAEDAGQSLTLVEPAARDSKLVFGDRELLTQLFANLIENAIRHAGKGARISINIDRDGDTVTMAVTDDGPGIPAEEYDRVVGRFYRLEKSRTSDGSGLGLSLSNAIARLHNAEMVLGDARPGLRITVRFPPFEVALKEIGGHL